MKDDSDGFVQVLFILVMVILAIAIVVVVLPLAVMIVGAVVGLLLLIIWYGISIAILGVSVLCLTPGRFRPVRGFMYMWIGGVMFMLPVIIILIMYIASVVNG